jgi:hypothetical protein
VPNDAKAWLINMTQFTPHNFKSLVGSKELHRNFRGSFSLVPTELGFSAGFETMELL